MMHLINGGIFHKSNFDEDTSEWKDSKTIKIWVDDDGDLMLDFGDFKMSLYISLDDIRTLLPILKK